MNLKKSDNPKKVALIGVGRWGYNILNTLDSIEELDLTHVVTTKQLKLEYKNQNPKLLSNWKDILNFEVDAVIIATPPATHSCILEWFIKNGHKANSLRNGFDKAMQIANLILGDIHGSSKETTKRV